MVAFVAKLVANGQLGDFVRVRSAFESFMLEYDYLAQQINRKFRTAQRSYPYVSSFFEHVRLGLARKEPNDLIIDSIRKMNDFNFVTIEKPQPKKGKPGEKFTRDDKSAIFLRDVLQTAPRCRICQGYVHRNAISIDHIERRVEGGTSGIENGQLTHPYCNTGYKH